MCKHSSGTRVPVGGGPCHNQQPNRVVHCIVQSNLHDLHSSVDEYISLPGCVNFDSDGSWWGEKDSVYFSCLNSLGAAHCVAQCWRWKTAAVSVPILTATTAAATAIWTERTFFDAVLLGALVVGIICLRGDTFNTLVEMMLVARTLSGTSAVCRGFGQPSVLHQHSMVWYSSACRA